MNKSLKEIWDEIDSDFEKLPDWMKENWIS